MGWAGSLVSWCAVERREVHEEEWSMAEVIKVGYWIEDGFYQVFVEFSEVDAVFWAVVDIVDANPDSY